MEKIKTWWKWLKTIWKVLIIILILWLIFWQNKNDKVKVDTETMIAEWGSGKRTELSEEGVEQLKHRMEEENKNVWGWFSCENDCKFGEINITTTWYVPSEKKEIQKINDTFNYQYANLFSEYMNAVGIETRVITYLVYQWKKISACLWYSQTDFMSYECFHSWKWF